MLLIEMLLLVGTHMKVRIVVEGGEIFEQHLMDVFLGGVHW